jgi:hypothetical protein
VSTRNKVIRAAAWVAVLSVAGCATAPKFHTQLTPVVLPINSVYIYSFLDVREKQLGVNFLQAVQHDLQDELTQHGVRSKQLWFNSSPQRAEFSLNESAPRGLRRESTVRIPVLEVIGGNASDERAFGASYRLVMSPSDITNSGVGFDSQVTWILTDVKSGQVVWRATSRMSTVNLIKVDEDPSGRAQLFVHGLMQEMAKENLL